MKNKIFKFEWFIVLLLNGLLFFSCDSNENYIKIISINPNEGYNAGVTQSITIEIEYTLSTDDLGHIHVGFNSEYNYRDPNRFPSSESYTINKGSGKITFNGTVTPIDWSSYNSSFDVMVTLTAYKNGRLGDLVADRKVIMK